MKKLFLILLCLSVSLLNAGCQSNKTRVAEGAIVGSVLGAAAGGIIGHQSGHGGEGAGIGAAVGAVTGAIVGSQMEKPSQTTQSTSQTAATNPNQMSIQQIVDLSNQGVDDRVIIDRIYMTNSRFVLSLDEINYLRSQGVSQQVIDVMVR